MDFVADQIEEIVERDEKAVIFSSFPNVALPRLAERLAAFQPLLFTGEMSTDEREMVHRRFLDDPSARVMCASLKAAGVGITWTVASHVYHLDLWWNPQALRQAEDRVHRIGQTEPVLVKRLVAEGTIEDGIKDLLALKEDVFDLVLGTAPDLSRDMGTFEQLLSLIGLKRDDVRSVSRGS